MGKYHVPCLLLPSALDAQFRMLKAAEVEIKKDHQVLMVNKTTSFKKKGKWKKGTFN